LSVDRANISAKNSFATKFLLCTGNGYARSALA
jgi:hypothetical protein